MESKEIKDLKINCEYLTSEDNFDNFVFPSSHKIKRIKVIRRTKNCSLIGYFDEINNNLCDAFWKENDCKINVFEDLIIEQRKEKLDKLDKI